MSVEEFWMQPDLMLVAPEPCQILGFWQLPEEMWQSPPGLLVLGCSTFLLMVQSVK